MHKHVLRAVSALGVKDIASNKTKYLPSSPRAARGQASAARPPGGHVVPPPPGDSLGPATRGHPAPGGPPGPRRACASAQRSPARVILIFKRSLKSGRLIPPVPFFFLKIVLAIQNLVYFHTNCEIICSTLRRAGNWASLVAQLVKNLPAMWETWV